MAHHGKLTAAKRQREKRVAERRREKAARRAEVKERRKSQHGAVDGIDPDIANIVPGPQPLLSWQIEE